MQCQSNEDLILQVECLSETVSFNLLHPTDKACLLASIQRQASETGDSKSEVNHVRLLLQLPGKSDCLCLRVHSQGSYFR